jgi:aspartyl aminopeptidase
MNILDKTDFNEALLGFLDASPTPYHATANMAGMLENAGYERLDEAEEWLLERGRKYYVTRNDASVIAFTYPGEDDYIMVGAHTDSPNLRLKPNPVIEKEGAVQLGVQTYGGLLMKPWFDRDLSIAGRVAYRTQEASIGEALVNFREPVAMIPSLAIHLNPEANKGGEVNPQTELVPIIGAKPGFDFDAWLLDALKEEGIDDAEKILSHDLSLYDTQQAGMVGIDREFIASARLDNLLSCYIALLAACSVSADRPFLMVCSDHEEVGSASTTGAAGPFLESVLRRVCGSYETFSRMMHRSLMISCDNAHAVHPNYSDKHDVAHAPRINKGVVIKINANQRYASSTRSISHFVHAAEKVGKQVQEFVTRADMGCGSTIGPITATRLGIETIDVGLPTFAMHSIREHAGSDDAYDLYEILLELGR